MYKKNGDGGGWMSPDGIKREEKTPPTVKKKKKLGMKKGATRWRKMRRGVCERGAIHRCLIVFKHFIKLPTKFVVSSTDTW